MLRILVINSSASGEASVSRRLVEDTVQELLAVTPGASVVQRDLGDAHIPHLTPETVNAIRATAQTDTEQRALALSDELIAELQNTDVLVLGAPMYNFSMPTTLRAWFDHVLRPRVTFAYGENGVTGLLNGIRAIVVQTRGGQYTQGPAKAFDFQEPYLKHLLGFVGINDVSFIHAERIQFGPEAKNDALEAAKAEIKTAVARIVSVKTEEAPPAAMTSDQDGIRYDLIMEANLQRVFGERDATRRYDAIREIYTTDAILHEPGSSAQGHDAISQAVTDLLAHLPPEFIFTAVRPAHGHNGVGRLQWWSGPLDGPVAVTGTDVAHFENGMIKMLHVFLDQQER